MQSGTPSRSPKDMVWIPGGSFLMGSEDFSSEERPVHPAQVAASGLTPIRSRSPSSGGFVRATGHVTVAETAPDPADYPDADPDLLVPGFLVFTPPLGRSTPGPPVVVVGARRPLASPGGSGRRTVTARTAPGHACRIRRCARLRGLGGQGVADGGRVGVRRARWPRRARAYTWGDEFTPSGRIMANTWQGHFPHQNLAARRLRPHLTGRKVPGPTATGWST